MIRGSRFVLRPAENCRGLQKNAAGGFSSPAVRWYNMMIVCVLYPEGHDLL